MSHLPDTPGELRYIEALGGGALMDLGCYCMHWIRTVAGDEPTVVSAAPAATRRASTSRPKRNSRSPAVPPRP